MSSSLSARGSFWAPLVVAVITGVITASAVYGAIGATVNRNTRDIQELQQGSKVVTDILVSQGEFRTELAGVRRQVDRILIIVNR